MAGWGVGDKERQLETLLRLRINVEHPVAWLAAVWLRLKTTVLAVIMPLL